MKQRKIWIDWMKALGMLAIVWGHCFPKGGVDAFLYAFNVPVFFWVSGYLVHREESMRVCWQKCWHNLVIPYIILALIKCAGPILKHLSDGQFVYSLLGIAGGFHSINGISGCNNLWFVYTLVLIKLLYQWGQADQKRLLGITILAIIFALVYNHYELEWSWAVSNTLLAWPFFLLGNTCSQVFSRQFDNFVQCFEKVHWAGKILVIASLIALIYCIGLQNDCAYLFQNRYGLNFLLFVAGALAGILMMLSIGLLLNQINLKAVRIISVGSIVILVFHRELLRPLLKLIRKQELDLSLENLLIFLAAVAVTLAFVPIILVLKRFFPIILGTRAKNL